MQTNTKKIELTGYLILGEIKLYKLKNVYFEEKISKSKKNITILHFMTILNNITLKVEICFELRGCSRPL